MKGYSFILICMCYALVGCTPAPQPIAYGEDACHSCLMTIVDERHAAELVSTKGKVYKFDAIECMLRSMSVDTTTEYALAFVCDYNAPGKFIDAKKATYLVSPSLPSPMGEFLSAFASPEQATKMQQEKDGQVYDWASLPDVILD